MIAAKTRRPAPARVLLIDDDSAVREATELLLDGEGYDVVPAAHGEAGIAAMQAGAFDLVIVDLFMPGMDGLETTKAIRDINPTIPVIAVSGFMLGHHMLEMPNFGPMAAEAGAIATLYKPFKPDALFQAIAHALGHNAAETVSR